MSSDHGPRRPLHTEVAAVKVIWHTHTVAWSGLTRERYVDICGILFGLTAVQHAFNTTVIHVGPLSNTPGHSSNWTVLRQRKPPPRRLTSTESDPGFEPGFPD